MPCVRPRERVTQDEGLLLDPMRMLVVRYWHATASQYEQP